ncbi:DinB superfamily protein [Anatilimnocola aggregata]|uniref:DinB superfamily protein n=1 Tax=Anatilimnocola aggregata TaxID=2528021 RepID=A0A517YEW7_9BACT|nr:DinB family protein [Anatilimnocola aggregata]QDU28773.1 DinB superfamily protein [Anatilimnocola aggregata]
MSTVERLLAAMQFNRTRTLALLDKIEHDAELHGALAYRPGPGRAHIAWQLMHIGITEELFATERLADKKAAYAELVPRFKGGSTPDDDIPTAAQIRQVLLDSRQHLLATLRTFDDSQLTWMPPALAERKLSFLDVLHILNWHEGHHQGQAHITLNLYKASR